MPKSGQRYERDFLARSPLSSELWAFARPLVDRPGWPTLGEYTEFVDAERRARAPELEPVRFAPAALPRRRGRARAALELGQLYDGRIALERQVPCLEASYHDLFNALVWAAFPRSKRALHARQFRALQRRWQPGQTRLPNRRTPEQDALTIFDEGGCVVLGVEPEAPRAILFGHAVMEHVCFATSPVRAAALAVVPDAAEVAAPDAVTEASGRALFEAIDCALAPRLADEAELTRVEFDGVLSITPPGRCTFAREAGRPRESAHALHAAPRAS